MKKSEEIIVSDKDIQQIEKLVVVVNRTIEALKAQDDSLKKIAKSFEKVGNSASKFAEAAKSIGEAGKSINTFITALGTAESKLSSMVVKLTTALDKMAQGKNAMVQAQYGEAVTTQKARSAGTPKKQSETGERASDIQALLSIRAEYNNALRTQIELMQEIRDMYEKSPDKSADLASFTTAETMGIQSKIDAIKELIALTDVEIQKLQMMNLAAGDSMSLNMNTAKVQNAQENPDWKAAKDMEAEYQRIVAVNAQLYGILQQIVVLKEKIGLSTTEEANELSLLVAKYKQITAESKAIADNKTFDRDKYANTSDNKQQTKAKKLDVDIDMAGTSTAAEIALQTQMLNNQRDATNEVAQAEMARARLAEGRTAYMTEEQQANRMAIEEDKQRTQQLDREIELTIKLKLVKENQKNTEEALLAVKEKIKQLQSGKGSKQEIKDAKDHEKALKGEAQGLNTVRKRLEENAKANKSFMESNTAAYYTTEQFMQVVRELPNFAISARTGIMSLSNNLPQMISGFHKAWQGGLGFSGILKNLVSPMSIVNMLATGLMIAFMNWDGIVKFFTNDIISLSGAFKEVSKGIGEMNSDASKSLKSFEDLRYELGAFPENLGNLEKYNDEFGKTYGIATSIADAYNLMTANAENYYQRVIRHEIANQLRMQTFTAMSESLSDQLKSSWYEMFSEDELVDKIEKSKSAVKSFSDMINQVGVSPALKIKRQELGMVWSDAEVATEGIEMVAKAMENVGLSSKMQKTESAVAVRYSFRTDMTPAEKKKILDEIKKFGQVDVKAAFDEFILSQGDLLDMGNALASMFDLSVPSADKDEKSFKERSAKALNIKTRTFKDMYVKEEQYNERRAKLEILNELLSMNIAANSYNTEAHILEERLKSYAEFYKNKQELAEIDRDLTMRKIAQDAIAQKKSAEDKVRVAKQQISEDQQRLADYRKQVAEESVKSNEEFTKYQKATLAKLDKEKTDLLVEYQRLKDASLLSESKEKEMKTRYDSLVAQAESLSSTQDIFIAKSASIAAAAEANINKSIENRKELERNVATSILMIQSNANLLSLAAIDKFGIDVVKLRREQLQGYADLYKGKLDDDARVARNHYDEQIRTLERYLHKRKMAGKSLGGVGYEDTVTTKRDGKVDMNKAQTNTIKSLDFIGQALSSYSPSPYLADMQQLKTDLEAIKMRAKAVSDQNAELQKSYANVIKEVEKFGKETEITKEMKHDWGKKASDEAIASAKLRGLSESEAADEGAKAYQRTIDIIVEATKSGVINLTTLHQAQQKLEEERVAAKEKTADDIVNIEGEMLSSLEKAAVDAGLALAKGLMEMGQALFDYSIEMKKRQLGEWRETQNQLITDAVASQVLTQKEGDAQRKALDEEERKRKYEIAMQEFKAKQAMAYADIAISSAVGMAMAWVAAGGFSPLAIAIMAMMGATAIASIVSVAAQPPPAYAEGTAFHKGGLAIVGDGGRSEAVVTPSGNIYKTPNTDTLINLQRGSKVMPDFDAFMFRQAASSGGDVNVQVDNRRMLDLQRQTNRNLSQIARNTKTQQKNYNRLWIN